MHAIANDRIRRRNYSFEFKVKFNTEGGVESDLAQVPGDYHLFHFEDCNSKYCNCLPGLSVEMEHWHLNTKTIIQGSKDTWGGDEHTGRPSPAERARGLASATGVWLLPVHSGSSPASVLPARRRRATWTISWCHSVLYYTAPQQHPSFQQPTWHLGKTPLRPFVLTGCNPHPLQALLFGR